MNTYGLYLIFHRKYIKCNHALITVSMSKVKIFSFYHTNKPNSSISRLLIQTTKHKLNCSYLNISHCNKYQIKCRMQHRFLYSKALKLEFTVNVPNETGFDKLCGFNEILNLTEKIRTNYWRTDRNNRQYMRRLSVIRNQWNRRYAIHWRGNIIKYGITKEILFKLCEYLKISIHSYSYERKMSFRKLHKDTSGELGTRKALKCHNRKQSNIRTRRYQYHTPI